MNELFVVVEGNGILLFRTNCNEARTAFTILNGRLGDDGVSITGLRVKYCILKDKNGNVIDQFTL